MITYGAGPSKVSISLAGLAPHSVRLMMWGGSIGVVEVEEEIGGV